MKAAGQNPLCIHYSSSSSQYRSLMSAKWIIMDCDILSPTSTWLWPVQLSAFGEWYNVNDGNFWLLTGGMEIWVTMTYVLMYLNTWLPTGGTVWEEWGVKEVVTGFEISKAHVITSWLSLGLMAVLRCELSPTAPPWQSWTLTLWNCKLQSKCFTFVSCFGHDSLS